MKGSFFSGRSGAAKVSLGGKSAKSESKEEVLERTRQERERRARARAEQQAATTIQASWRRWNAGRQARKDLEAQWQSNYGQHGQGVDRSALAISNNCLPMLLFLAQLPSSDTTIRQRQQQSQQGTAAGQDDMAVDTQEAAVQGLGLPALSAVCTSLVQVIQSPPGLAALLDTSGSHADQQRLLQSRLQRLAGLVLATLTHHRVEFASALLEVPSLNTASAPAAMMQLLVALVQPSTWQPVVSGSGGAIKGAASAQECAWQVASSLALGSWNASSSYSSRQRGGTAAETSALFRCLAQLCLASAPHRSRRPSGMSDGSPSSNAQRWLQQTQQGGSNGVSASGAQASQQQQTVQLDLLISGLLTPLLNGSSHMSLLSTLAAEQGPHLLLCVPDLWATWPAVRPLAPALVQAAAASLARVGTAGLCQLPGMLLSEQDGAALGRLGSAAALLGNLAVGGPIALAPASVAILASQAQPGAPAGSSPAAQQQVAHSLACSLATALHSLLCVLPFPSLLRMTRAAAAAHASSLVASGRAGQPVASGSSVDEEDDEWRGGALSSMHGPLPAVTGAPPAAAPYLSSLPRSTAGAEALLSRSMPLAANGSSGSSSSSTSSASTGTPTKAGGRPSGAAGGSGVLRDRFRVPTEAHLLAAASPWLLSSLKVLLERGGQALLSALVATLLPYRSVEERRGPAALSRSQLVEGARELSLLLLQWVSLPGMRVRLLLSLAVNNDLVPRLWFSALRGALLNHPDEAEPAAATSSQAAGASSGSSGTAQAGGQQQATGAAFGFSAPAFGSSAPTFGSSAAAFGTSAPGIAASQAALPGAGDRLASPASGAAGKAGQQAQEQQQPQQQDLTLPLALFCAVFHSHITVSSYDNFFSGSPLPLQEIYDPKAPTAGLLSLLKDRLWSALWFPEQQQQLQMELQRQQAQQAARAYYGNHSLSALVAQQAALAPELVALQLHVAAWVRHELVRAGGQLYSSLFSRNTGGGRGRHKPFAPINAFYASSLGPERFVQEANASKAAALAASESEGRQAAGRGTDVGQRIWQVLRYAAPLAPFEERARLLQSELETQRQAYMDSELMSQHQALMAGHVLPPKFVSVRRDRLLMDGYEQLMRLGPDGIKGRVRVQFVDASGHMEAGVDGGGLFKDFMESLIKEGFGESMGLFKTNTQRELYPSPDICVTSPEVGPPLLQFCGRMLGKALWEGILLDLPIARFVLKQVRGGRCDLHDLPSLDDQLYRNLLSLKTYPGDVSELGLTFSADVEAGGMHREVELKRGGRDIPVTNESVEEYIALMANRRLNLDLAPAVNPFIAGLHEMIEPRLLAMFNEAELQALISGRSESDGEGRDQGLDIDDMMAHTNYAGGYHEDHPVVHVLWQVLRAFTPSEQRLFLKFVTACSRAPLLGFRYLEPKLCVQMAGGVLDPGSVQRLPTAATCMNLLKLPPYQTFDLMKQKLLTAITGAQTFDLS